MKLLPVLDILDGHVVRGIAGRRADYRRIVSSLTSSSDPFHVAQAIRDRFGLNHLYLADLDAIIHQRSNLKLYRRLIDEGFNLLVDAGIRNFPDARVVRDAGVTRIVVGLETCQSPEELMNIVAAKMDVTFGLDLFQGAPRVARVSRGWADHPQSIIRQAVQANVNAILPLDLSDVGTSTGGSTDHLCRFIRAEFPEIGLITGGGVRGDEDLKRMSSLGVDATLVASALHDGRLTREHVKQYL